MTSAGTHLHTVTPMTTDRIRDYYELFGERAAIREYEGKMDRERAELAAWAEMPPDDGGAWLQFIDPAPSQQRVPPARRRSR